MQYSEDLAQSWAIRASAKSWKTEIADVQNDEPVHIVTEAVCPDRYHIVVSGAKTSETYFVASRMYHRNGKGPWTQEQMGSRYPLLSSCDNPAQQPADPARVRMLAQQFKDIQLGAPLLREFGGRKCREWSRTYAGESSATACFDLTTHALVHLVTGKTEITYYWNIPLEINPPL